MIHRWYCQICLVICSEGRIDSSTNWYFLGHCRLYQACPYILGETRLHTSRNKLQRCSILLPCCRLHMGILLAVDQGLVPGHMTVSTRGYISTTNLFCEWPYALSITWKWQLWDYESVTVTKLLCIIWAIQWKSQS